MLTKRGCHPFRALPRQSILPPRSIVLLPSINGRFQQDVFCSGRIQLAFCLNEPVNPLFVSQQYQAKFSPKVFRVVTELGLYVRGCFLDGLRFAFVASVREYLWNFFLARVADEGTRNGQGHD